MGLGGWISGCGWLLGLLEFELWVAVWISLGWVGGCKSVVWIGLGWVGGCKSVVNVGDGFGGFRWVAALGGFKMCLVVMGG